MATSVKGRDFMFIKKNMKSIVAVMCVVAMLVANTAAAVAAPYSFGNADAVREKALGEYFSSGIKLIAMQNSSDAKAESAEKAYSEEVVVSEAINFNTVKRLNTELTAGETVTVREGVQGAKSVTYKVNYENGEEVSREVVSEVITAFPVDKIVEYGSNVETVEAPVVNTEAGTLDYKYVITCEATAYDLSPEENGGYAGQTATGVPLDRGVIAVDPKIIPLGSRVYIEALDGSWSYGYAVAADTGGAIKGYRVDLCYRTKSECREFGRRPCRVYILN